MLKHWMTNSLQTVFILFKLGYSLQMSFFDKSRYKDQFVSQQATSIPLQIYISFNVLSVKPSSASLSIFLGRNEPKLLPNNFQNETWKTIPLIRQKSRKSRSWR